MGVEATSTVISSMEAAGVIMASGAVVVWVSQFSEPNGVPTADGVPTAFVVTEVAGMLIVLYESVNMPAGLGNVTKVRGVGE